METKNNKDSNVFSIIKSKNNALKQGLYVVLIPDTPDEHGDVFTVEAIEKGCHSFNKHNPPSNLCHVMNTDSFSVIESYVTPSEVEIDGNKLPKGTWLQKYQFSDAIWDDVLLDKFSGVSIKAEGSYIEVEQE